MFGFGDLDKGFLKWGYLQVQINFIGFSLHFGDHSSGKLRMVRKELWSQGYLWNSMDIFPKNTPFNEEPKKHRLKISDDPIWVPHGITVSRYHGTLLKKCSPPSLSLL
jgi:hypothetical protein